MDFKEEYRFTRQLREHLAIREKHDFEVRVLRTMLDVRKNTISVPTHIMNRPYSNTEILNKVAVIRVLRRELDRLRRAVQPFPLISVAEAHLATLLSSDDLSSLSKLYAGWLKKNVADMRQGVRFVVMSASVVRPLKCGGMDIGNEDEKYKFEGWCLVDALNSEIVGTDGGEPEDQLLVRDWGWVATLANELSAKAF